MNYVIDISEFNGNVDFAKIPNYYGCIIRVGYRGYGSGKIVADKQAKNNLTELRKYNIPFGLYFMSSAITAEEAIEEANYCCDLLPEKVIAMPVFIDCEDVDGTNTDRRSDSLSKPARTKIAIAFCNQIKNRGYIGGVYASESWFNYKLNAKEIIAAGCRPWVAKYSTTAPNIGTTYVGWQYTSGGTVDGIGGKCDLSKWYIKYYTDYSYVSPETPVTNTAKDRQYAVTKNSAKNCEAAHGYDSVYNHEYKVTAKSGLIIRAGAGVSKRQFAVLPYGSYVRCYGYYNNYGGNRWYYVISDSGYIGYCISTYLSKV